MVKVYGQGIFIALLGLLGLALVGLILTREWGNPSLRQDAGQSSTAGESSLVDEQPLVTARILKALTVTPEEQQFAEEALRLADQDVDLAFDAALQDLAEHPISITPQGRQLQARVKQAQAHVTANQEEVARLTKLVAGAHGNQKDSLQGQLEMAQAQLALDQDELEDAQRDLMRAGGDAHSRLQRLLAEHEASQTHANPNAPRGATAATGQATNREASAGSLLAVLSTWIELREKWKQLRQAQQEAKAREAELTRSHDSLQREMQQKVSKKKTQPQQAIGPPAAASGPKQVAPAGVSTLRRLSQDLAGLDERIETEQKLGNVYGTWGALVRGRELASLRGLIQSGFWIILILFLAFLADHFVSRFFLALAPDRKRLLSARSVLHFSTRALAVVLILFVVFGPPSQLATIVALAGAGLTVALKDFIVGFFGWFVLMGRNGVRPGDWVEINGVQGKVIEVGLLHTVILETGNWTDAGHPTGRKVTFVNSFAIENHYFNFSTAGQWLWDEVQVALPSGTDPYPVVEAIQKLVAAETEANARLAEQEWRRATTTSGLRSFSAAPTISVRPSHSGVNVIVRFITRADERDELRSRLYRDIFGFLIGKHVLQPAVEGAAREPGAGVG